MTGSTTRAADLPVPVPRLHADLLSRPVCAVLTTIGSDGGPQSSLVWVDFDGECPRVATTAERQKGRNMRVNPKVSLLVVDPDDTSRFLQVRGDAELTTEGAIEHLDLLTRRYTTHPRYYGYVYPEEQRTLETRVIARVRPRWVTVDAIHHG